MPSQWFQIKFNREQNKLREKNSISVFSKSNLKFT